MQGEATLFVVDEDTSTQAAVMSLADAMHLRCEAFDSEEQFLRVYDASRSGCLITEVRGTAVSGLRLLQQLAAEGATLPVIFLTANATVPLAVRALRTGAVHLLEKPASEEDLWDAVQEALHLNRQRRRAECEQERMRYGLGKLNERERQVLEGIAQGRQNREIAKDLGIAVRTAELARARMMTKLGLNSLVDLLRFAIGAFPQVASETPERERVSTGVGATALQTVAVGGNGNGANGNGANGNGHAKGAEPRLRPK